MKKIAILGATGYIGKSLLYEFSTKTDLYQVYAFSRTQEKMDACRDELALTGEVMSCAMDVFSSHVYDVIINCTGVGDPHTLVHSPAEVFSVTETTDSLVLEYLTIHPHTIYINMSSGAVYGENASSFVTDETPSVMNVNAMTTGSQYYAIAKLHAEAKHRALKELHIVDLRIFGFFSRFVRPETGFFLSEIVSCLQEKKTFITKSHDMIRDYTTQTDLYDLIEAVLRAGPMNDWFDMRSRTPVTKFELLDAISKNYGLVYRVEDMATQTPPGKKDYYSTSTKTAMLSYEPRATALEAVLAELAHIPLT